MDEAAFARSMALQLMLTQLTAYVVAQTPDPAATVADLRAATLRSLNAATTSGGDPALAARLKAEARAVIEHALDAVGRVSD